MTQPPIHQQLFRLVHHLSTTPISMNLKHQSQEQLQGRARKLERRRKKTKQLIESLQRRMLAKKQ